MNVIGADFPVHKRTKVNFSSAFILAVIKRLMFSVHQLQINTIIVIVNVIEIRYNLASYFFIFACIIVLKNFEFIYNINKSYLSIHLYLDHVRTAGILICFRSKYVEETQVLVRAIESCH